MSDDSKDAAGDHEDTTVLQNETSVFGTLKQYAARLVRPAEAPATVLIVDDEEPVLRFVERVLRDKGYQTFVASSGPEAIETAAKIGTVDVLVTDVMMPHM